jgi:hypothetical protein
MRLSRRRRHPPLPLLLPPPAPRSTVRRPHHGNAPRSLCSHTSTQSYRLSWDHLLAKAVPAVATRAKCRLILCPMRCIPHSVRRYCRRLPLPLPLRLSLSLLLRLRRLQCRLPSPHPHRRRRHRLRCSDATLMTHPLPRLMPLHLLPLPLPLHLSESAPPHSALCYRGVSIYHRSFSRC